MCQQLYVFVRDEKTGDISEEPASPDSPPALTVLQTKIFALINLVEDNPGFGGFIDQFVKFTHFRLLGGDHPMRRMRTFQLVNLSRMLATIWKSRGNIFVL